MRSNGSGVTQVCRKRQYIQLVKEVLRILIPPLHIEGYYASPLLHLLLGQLILRMAEKKWIFNPVYLFMFVQKRSQLQGITTVAIHAHRQGFQTFGKHPGIERRKRRSTVAGKYLHRFYVFIRTYNNTTNSTALSVNKLSCRMNHNIGSPIHWLL